MVWDVESDQVTLMMYTCGVRVRAGEWMTSTGLQVVPDTIEHGQTILFLISAPRA